MSWDDVRHAMEMSPQWENPMQYAVLLDIARWYNPKFGYAWPSLQTLGDHIGRSPRRVNEVVVELEGLGLVVRLGPDYNAGHQDGVPNRYVPIWRVEAGVQQMLRDAIEHDAGEGGDPATGRMGPCEGSHGDHARVRMETMRGLAWDLSTYVRTDLGTAGTGTAATASQPRLPAVLAQIRRTLVEEILRKRYAFLATDAAKDTNFKHVAKAAGDIRLDPELGARLVKGYDAKNETDVRDAIRLLCEKRHVDWGKPYYDLIHSAIEWDRVRLSIQNGEARPRDKARKA